MNNVVNSLNNFLRNKNIVTVAGVIIIIAILYWGYNRQIQNQVQPMRGIPYATQLIPPGTLIDDSMIDTVDISPIVFNHGDIARTSSEVINKYVDYNTIIPQGSLFYRDVLIDEDDLPDSVFTKVKDGDVVSRLAVSTEKTYGNSMFPGNKFDLYMKINVPVTRQVMVGKLLENIEILAVKDSQGRDVFQNRETTVVPNMLIFGLPPEQHILLFKASYLQEFQVDLVPVPHGGTVERPGGTEVSSEALRQFIEAYTVPNPEFMTGDDISLDDLLNPVIPDTQTESE